MTQVLRDMTSGGKVAPERITGIQSRMEDLLQEMTQIATEAATQQMPQCPVFPTADGENMELDNSQTKRKIEYTMSTPEGLKFTPTAQFTVSDDDEDLAAAEEAFGLATGVDT